MEGRGADPFQVFGRALRIVSLIATKGRLCVEPTSSTRVAGPSARVPRENSVGLIRPALADQTDGADYYHRYHHRHHRSFFFFFPFSLSSFFPFRLSPAACCKRLIHQPRRTAEKGRASFSPKLSLRALFVALDA